MDGDRVAVSVEWVGGFDHFTASLTTGDAEIERELRATRFHAQRVVRLSSEELARLRMAAGGARASDRELVHHDPWSERSTRVEVWLGGEHVVVSVDGELHSGGAFEVAELTRELLKQYLPHG